MAQFTFTENNEKKTQHRIRVWQASVNNKATSAPVGTILSADKTGIVVATAQGTICLEVLQLPNKKALNVQDILNGKAHWFEVGANINGAVINGEINS